MEPLNRPNRLLRGTVRKGRNGTWWRSTASSWKRVHTKKTKRRRASQRRINRAKITGMIKVFYQKPKFCNLIATNQRKCYSTPRTLETGWKLGNQLQPYSTEHKFTHIDEYMGPINKMAATKRLLHKHFTNAMNDRYVLSYEMQAHLLFDKYKGWGIA